MWTAATGTLMGVFAGHGGEVTCGKFTYDGKRVITGSSDCSVRVWNPKDQSTSMVFTGRDFHSAPVNAVTTKFDSQAKVDTLVLSGGQDNMAFLMNLNTGKVSGRFNAHTNSVECAGFSNTNPFAFTGEL